MKQAFSLLAFFLLGSFAINAQDATGPVMTFPTTTVDYGKIEKGSDKVRKFAFTNTGNEPLVIKSAKGSCGCTVPEYPKDLVKPGDTATIAVTFNSAGKQGEQHKNVTVVCNTVTRNEMLYLTGFVKVKE